MNGNHSRNCGGAMTDSYAVLRRFDSMVNDVCLVSEVASGRRFVRKVYGSVAKQTGVSLPLERACLEYRTYLMFESKCELLHGGIVVPRVRDRSRHETWIETEYLEGAVPLRQLALTDWPGDTCFLALGKTIAAIGSLKFADFSSLFLGFWDVQQQLGKAIRDFKLDPTVSQAYHPPSTNRDAVLALGDLSLGNILAWQAKLALIDFEFVHVSSQGYDAGQLLAEIRVLRSNADYHVDKHLDRCERAFLEGYASIGGDISHALFWASQFAPYYRERVRTLRR